MAPEKSEIVQILWQKSRERFAAIQTNAEAHHLEIALEQAHLCVEIAMNAVLAENGWSLDQLKVFNHSLKDLAAAPCGGVDLIANKMRGTENKKLRADFQVISSVWRMQYRYEKLPREAAEILELLPIFERVFKWIEANFNKSVNN